MWSENSSLVVFLSILFSLRGNFVILWIFINYYVFSYTKKIARAFGARIFANYLKILARIFEAMMLTNFCSGLLLSTNFNLGSGRKSDELMEKLGNQKLTGHPVHGCIRTAPSRLIMQRNWHGCPFRKKCYREGAMLFSRMLFSGIGAPYYQIKMSYIVPYIRSNLLYFSYISRLNLLYFRPSPIFLGSLVAWHPVYGFLSPYQHPCIC